MFHELLQYIVLSANIASAILMPIVLGFGVRALHHGARYFKRK